MAKSRAQRKAERRRREAQLERERQAGGGQSEAQAQHDTSTPISGDVAEAEAVIRTGANPEDYGEQTVEHDAPAAPEDPEGQARAAVPGVTPEPVRPVGEPEPPPPPAPAPSRADVGRPDEPQKESRRERRRREKEREKDERKRAKQKDLQKAQAEKADKRRGGVLGFFASCWAELKKVQWPDRDTLVQASAVTIIFVAVAAAYLGTLDAIFNWLIKQLL